MFTPVQQRIMDKLNDGTPYTIPQLKSCLDDELASDNALAVHMAMLRKILKHYGRGILRETNGGITYYRQVMFIGTGE